MNLSRTLTAAAVTALSLGLSAGTLTPAVGADSSVTKAAPKKYVVTATANRTTAEQDDRVVIKGTVKKGDRGDRVVLEIKYDDAGWKKTDLTDKLDKKGRFKLVDEISSTRSRSYRVLKPASSRIKAGRSKAIAVAVYSWRELTTLKPVRSVGTTERSELKMNGVTYENSVSGSYGNQGGTDYNLDRKCTRLETRVGLADTSASTATGTAYLRTDGVQRYTGTFGLTQSSPVAVPLTNVFRLTFDWTSSNTAGTPEDQSGADVALGSPRILCRD